MRSGWHAPDRSIPCGKAAEGGALCSLSGRELLLQQSAVTVLSDGTVRVSIEASVELVGHFAGSVLLFHEAAGDDKARVRRLRLPMNNLGASIGATMVYISSIFLYM